MLKLYEQYKYQVFCSLSGIILTQLKGVWLCLAHAVKQQQQQQQQQHSNVNHNNVNQRESQNVHPD